MEEIHEGLLNSCGVAQVYHNCMVATGGPTRASIPSVLLRGKRQVTNVKFTRNSTGDPVNNLLVYARHKENSPVLHHSYVLTDTWVSGSEVMCSDISHFMTSDKMSYPSRCARRHYQCYLTSTFSLAKLCWNTIDFPRVSL